MDDLPKIQIDEIILPISRHKFGVMIALAIIISFSLVMFSMALYNSSGAAQLDLSRPGYNDIRDKIEKTDDFEDYSIMGPINTSSVADFKLLFVQKATKINSVDIFGGDPLSPTALGLIVEIVQ